MCSKFEQDLPELLTLTRRILKEALIRAEPCLSTVNMVGLNWFLNFIGFAWVLFRIMAGRGISMNRISSIKHPPCITASIEQVVVHFTSITVKE